MKKFTAFLSVLLFATVGAQAQKVSVPMSATDLSSEKAYTISCARGHLQAGATKMEQNATLTSASNQQFALVPDPDNNSVVYLYSVSEKKFLESDGNWGVGKTNPVYIFQTGNERYPYALSFSTDYMSQNMMLDGRSEFDINSWSNFDDGDQFVFTEVSGSEYSLASAQQLLSAAIDVTYFVKFNGTVVYSGVTKHNIGDAVALPENMKKAYCTYSYEGQPETITASTTEIIAQCEFAGPFQIFDSYAHINDWYFLDLKGGNYVYYKADATANVQLTTVRNETDDTQMWAFIGSPYDLKLVNRVAGEDYVLATKSPENNDYAVLTTLDDATYTQNSWTVDKSGVSYTNSFYICNRLHHDQALNFQTHLKYWNGRDGGSEFVMSDFADVVKNKLAPYYSLKGQMFGVSEEVYNLYHDRVVAAESSCTREECQALSELTLAGILYPETGYYRVRTSGARSMGDSYLAYRTGVLNTWQNVLLDGLVAIPASKVATDASALLKFTKIGYNQYKVSTEGFDIATQAESNHLYPKGEAATFSFYIYTPGKQIVAIHDDSNTTNPDYAYWHQGNWSTEVDAIVPWVNSEVPSRFTIEEANRLTINLNQASDNKYYATLNLPFAVELDGATANTMTVEGNVGTLTPVSGVLPQNTPVVLVGDNATATATIVADAEALSVDNALVGSNEEHAVADGELFLGRTDDNVIGFYRWTGEKLLPNRAYLPATAEQAKFVVFRGETTGISQLSENETNDNEAVRYNLAGQKVGKDYKGIVIVKNKKFVIR